MPDDWAGPATKRRCFDNNFGTGIITQPQSYLRLVCSDGTQINSEHGSGGFSTFDSIEIAAEAGPVKRMNTRNGERIGQLEEAKSIECCYGMLLNIPLKINTSSLRTTRIPLRFESPRSAVSTQEGEPARFEITCATSSRIIGELEAFAGIATQLYSHSKQSQYSSKNRGRGKGKIAQTWLLNIVIYGPVDLADVVGEYLSKHKTCLQDPLGTDRNVPYHNPHMLSSEFDEVVMTASFDSPLGNLEIERLSVGPNLLAQLMEDEKPPPETEAPAIVTTPLFSHQKQALSFMLRRERGWDMDGGYPDIWTKTVHITGQIGFTNNVSGTFHYESPEAFRGGLLADDMGLGKTLSMISLIAMDQTGNSLPSPPITPEPIGRAASLPIKTTLLIVPPPLIHAWENQLRAHIRPHTLKWRTFHGQNQTGVESLGEYDIVITTYQTLSAIWRKNIDDNLNSESLYNLIWHRVILDEAHMIQNSQNQLSQACFAIRSPRRWAITGTPIQNKLTDFASIVRFLNIYPYSARSKFDEDISRPWHDGDKQGYFRLKTLVRAITISRTKSVIHLPPRLDEVHHLDFSPAERSKYDATSKDTRDRVQGVLSLGKGSAFNALKRLNVLRLICCHGLLARESQEIENIDPLRFELEPLSFQGPGHGNPSVTHVCCQCGSDIIEELLEGTPLAGFQTHPSLINWDRTLCEQCDSQVGSMGPNLMPWDYRDPQQQFNSSGSSPYGSPSTWFEDDGIPTSTEFMSTKIKALVADLMKHSGSEKSGVFSFWTYTLDLVQIMLDECGILYTRIDGKLSLPKRAAALKAFQTDDSLRVILVSITCGGAGLDLTAASRAYLLEPHWNPMIEEQALCRVHRVGQRKPCTTIRYIMRDSFEEQVVKLQKRKQMLAEVTFGKAPLSENGIGLGTLDYLKSVLS